MNKTKLDDYELNIWSSFYDFCIVFLMYLRKFILRRHPRTTTYKSMLHCFQRCHLWHKMHQTGDIKLFYSWRSWKWIWCISISTSSFLDGRRNTTTKEKQEKLQRNNKLRVKLQRLIHTGLVLSGEFCFQQNAEGNLHFYFTNYRRCRFVEITGSFRNYYKSPDVPR